MGYEDMDDQERIKCGRRELKKGAKITQPSAPSGSQIKTESGNGTSESPRPADTWPVGDREFDELKRACDTPAYTLNMMDADRIRKCGRESIKRAKLGGGRSRERKGLGGGGFLFV